MRKLLLSDYDRTFFVDKEQILKNIEEIRKLRANGDCFAIVTGRKFESIKNETEKYDIPYDYLSCVDGSTLFNNNDELIKNYLMNVEECLKIKEDLDKKNELKLKMYREENCSDKNNDIIQCFYDVTNYDNIDRIYENAKEIAFKHDMNIEKLDFGYAYLIVINSGSTNKAVSGNDIRLIENINHEYVFAIGDHCNDFKMIEEFNGFAIKYALPELKSISRGVYDSVADLAYDITTRKLVKND